MTSTQPIGVQSGFGRLSFDPATGDVAVDGLGVLDVGVSVNGVRLRHERTEATVTSPLMGRIVQHLVGDGDNAGLTARVVWDAHATANLHLYVRLNVAAPIHIEKLELPRVALASAPGDDPDDPESATTAEQGDGWAALLRGRTALAVAVKKYPWLASWNDVGAYGHRTLADAVLTPVSPPVSGAGRPPVSAPVGGAGHHENPERPETPESPGGDGGVGGGGPGHENHESRENPGLPDNHDIYGRHDDHENHGRHDDPGRGADNPGRHENPDIHDIHEPERVANAVALVTSFPVALGAGQTLEAGVFLRRGDPAAFDFRAELRHEVHYDHRDEVRYVPEGEFAEQRVWETEDRWLGPPITEGAMQRPYDQLITRPLGLNVLARRRFTWSNEDFSLWRLTAKEHYRDSGVKKAFALLATQNEHGGWYEGVEFYNLPPRHHHMYDTYISGMFLLDAYDATGYDGFLEAAGRAVGFWVSNPPPANGHIEVAPGAWWYRWGGYVNELGYTDERCVLNTHSGATAFLAMYAERTGDPAARRGAEAGLAAVRWGLRHGIQRGDGQFLYCLSQVDPTLERPGDPPYIKLDLVPQIEDVYTVASSYRLMMALRSIPDAEVTAAVRRALDYWWVGHRAGTVYTYRAYSAIAFGVAAGEISLRYALALPEILRDREQFTSMQRGMSAFVAPHGLPLISVVPRGRPARFCEPVFVRRRRGEYLFALVNTEQPMRHIPLDVGLPDGVSLTGASVIDPAGDLAAATSGDPATATSPAGDLAAATSGDPATATSGDLAAATPVPWVANGDGSATLALEELQEFAVVVVRLELDEPDARRRDAGRRDG